jgi:hypothetical protein
MKRLLVLLVLAVLLLGVLEIWYGFELMEQDRLLRQWQYELGRYRDHLAPEYIRRDPNRSISV